MMAAMARSNRYPFQIPWVRHRHQVSILVFVTELNHLSMQIEPFTGEINADDRTEENNDG